MKLFWGQHTCAIGIHILLEEIGKPFDAEKIDVAGGATHQPPFSHVNPKGKVPVLIRDDGSVLTEYTAIATWLARTNPEKDLLPSDAEAEARGLEVMSYVEGTVHGQGFYRLFKPELFELPSIPKQKASAGSDGVKEQGRKMIEEGFEILDTQLAGHSFAAGDKFTIADTALFYVERWAPQNGIPLPQNLAAHLNRMKQRPAVQNVMKIWNEFGGPQVARAA